MFPHGNVGRKKVKHKANVTVSFRSSEVQNTETPSCEKNMTMCVAEFDKEQKLKVILTWLSAALTLPRTLVTSLF